MIEATAIPAANSTPCPSAKDDPKHDHGPASQRGQLCPLGDPVGTVPMRCRCCANCVVRCQSEAGPI
jgi:hypothetical protein